MNDLAIRDESNLCCCGSVHVRHAGLVVAIFAFTTALFDLLFLVYFVGIPLFVCDVAAGSAGIYAFCAGKAWAWLPLMILNILKTVLFAGHAFLALYLQIILYAVYSNAGDETEKTFAGIFIIVAVVITVGYVLAACLSAWFARLAYRVYTWQRNNGLPIYESCVAEKIDV